ncbi:hypothetical protein LPAF129_07680 [Ligilactobacillus pabuli]|uniref:Uncharacterized protein n=1 Tax=Ligilactobacillus pabuli TaxID=2886039 RepID=A0ABQ5JG87_9LACO|nr:hypothetical protein [Ligilactobacillus pabuli]GKS81083.1 hypothetical protein LPAF129_07680 [Ligilactobacillus pabuli]
MNSSQKRKLAFLVGAIWLTAIILTGISIAAWYFRPGKLVLLGLVICDFLVFSAACTTLTVPLVNYLRKRRERKQDSSKRPH